LDGFVDHSCPGASKYAWPGNNQTSPITSVTATATTAASSGGDEKREKNDDTAKGTLKSWSGAFVSSPVVSMGIPFSSDLPTKLVSAREAAWYYEQSCVSPCSSSSCSFSSSSPRGTPASKSSQHNAKFIKHAENHDYHDNHENNNYREDNDKDNDKNRDRDGDDDNDPRATGMRRRRRSPNVPLQVPRCLKRFVRESDLPLLFLAPELRYRRTQPISIGADGDMVAGVNPNNWLVLHMPRPAHAEHSDPGNAHTNGTVRQMEFVIRLIRWLLEHTEHIVGLNVHGYSYSFKMPLEHKNNQQQQQQHQQELAHKEERCSVSPLVPPPNKDANIQFLLDLAPKNSAV